MLYTIPDYYKEFQCIADRCEDTCCAGWEIVIDSKSLDRYRRAVKRPRGKLRGRLLTSVNWRRKSFRRDRENRCAFLNGENLCDLYAGLGKEYLCKTCGRYPRHVEEFEDVREVTLSVSCPEVARILMEKDSPVQFLAYEKPGEEEYEGYDPFLYSLLADAREYMKEILQNRSLSIDVRIILITGLAHDLQRRLNQEELFACQEVLERYQSKKAIEFAKKKQKEFQENQYDLSVRLFEKLNSLELLKEDWLSLAEESKKLVLDNGRENYVDLRRRFESWIDSEMPEWSIQMEQLLVYFMTTYFCGAVYDGEAYRKIRLTVDSVNIIRELLMARWVRNEGMISTEDVIEIVYRYSREMEHSDENLKRME